jgi:hypothetical protein
VADDRPKRLQSQTERDVAGWEARKERERERALRSPPRGVPIVPQNFDGFTDNYEGDELAAMRATRTPEDRLARLEVGRDEDRKAREEDRAQIAQLATAVTTMTTEVAGMRSELKANAVYVPQLIDLLKGKNDASITIAKDNNETKRLGMSNTTKIVMGVLGLLTTLLAGVVAGIKL